MERPGNIKLCYKEYDIHLKAKFKLLLCQEDEYLHNEQFRNLDKA